jgi:hypothetical protein
MVQIHKRSIHTDTKEGTLVYPLNTQGGGIYELVPTTPIGLLTTMAVLIHWKTKSRSDEGVGLKTLLSIQ